MRFSERVDEYVRDQFATGRFNSPITEKNYRYTLERLAEHDDDRLIAKLEERPDGCWQWLGCTDPDGYGRIRRARRTFFVHRYVYALLVGPIPEDSTLDHLCRNRACVNPAHLEPVSLRENLLRGTGFGARNAAKTHCANGHEFTAENTYRYRGHRACRECARAANRQYRVRKAAA